MRNPFEIVQWFEDAIAEYTGAPYAIATTSCTESIFLCCKYLNIQNCEVTIPDKTYLSVPQSIIQAGGILKFEDLEWQGAYQLKPFPIYDSAKRLTSNMYIKNSYMCLSFHHKKHLKIGKGGMILTDNPEQAARGLTLLSDYPKNVEDLKEDPPYRSLSTFDLFKESKI